MNSLINSSLFSGYSRKQDNQYQILWPKNYVISTGSKNAEQGLKTEIKQFFIHPKYDIIELYYDLGAIFLEKELVYDLNTQPGRLPEGTKEETSAMLDRYTKNKTECKTYGWGVTIARSLTDLNVVELHMVEANACQIILTQKKCKKY